MYLSNYIKTWPFEERPGTRLVYSTRRASMLLLNEETWKSIEEGDTSETDVPTLERLGILVPDKEAEKREVHNMIDRANSGSDGINVTVIMNLDCNFECVYCFENGSKGKKLYLTDETAGLLIDFIKGKFTEGKKAINIDFFGGEPLLSSRLIKEISVEMKSFTEGRDAKYTFTLVSNGSLLKRQLAEDLAKLGFTGVKITLDGPAELHNRLRPFKGGGGSFETIIRNIKETCDIVKIGIGGNFDSGNFGRFPLLLDFLEKEGLTSDRIAQVTFGPVMKRPAGDTSPADYTDGCMSINEPWLMKAGTMLREEVLKRGYNTPKIIPMPCQIELNDCYVVNYDGAIYKCPAFLGKKEYEIGHLKDGITNNSNPYRIGSWKNRECLECEYLPLCFGGCRYMSYIRNNNVEEIDCKRPYLDAMLGTLLKQDIKYRIKPALSKTKV
jgi:uncharacterized protein